MKYVIFILLSTFFIQKVSSQTLYESKTDKQSKFIFTTEFTRYIGVGTVKPFGYRNANLVSGLRLISFYQFFSIFQAGIGLGIDNAYIPVTLDMQVFIPKKNITPFIGGNIDYSMPLYSNGVPTMVYNPKLGIRKTITENFALQFSIGYRTSVQGLPVFSGRTGWQIGNVYYNWISTNFGFVF